MKAWRIYEPNHLKFDEMDAQPVGEGCVKLKMLRSAVSQMDVRLYSGKLKAEYPLILGRQGVGMVTEVGEGVTSYKRGDRVAVNPVTPCRSCSACVSGHTHECTHTLTYGMTEDGFLRDFAVVPADRSFIGLPDRISDTDAIFLEHIAMAINTVGALDLEKGEHIVVYGATLVGLILAQAAIYYQAVPVLVDMRADRLSLAESLGVYYTVNPVESDPFKKIFTITGRTHGRNRRLYGRLRHAAGTGAQLRRRRRARGVRRVEGTARRDGREHRAGHRQPAESDRRELFGPQHAERGQHAGQQGDQRGKAGKQRGRHRAGRRHHRRIGRVP